MTLGKMAADLAQIVAAYQASPTDERWLEIERFGICLEGVGGTELMNKVYDAAIDRIGIHAVQWVNCAWIGIGEWDNDQAA